LQHAQFRELFVQPRALPRTYVGEVKILHVVPTYVPAWRYGGPIHSVHGLCAALARRGHEVTVATTNVDGPKTSNVPICVPVPMDGITVRYFPSPYLRRIYYSRSMRSFFANEIRTFDLIHTHSVFLWPTSEAARWARRYEMPYVVSPRGMLVGDLIESRSKFAKRVWMQFFERRNISGASAVHCTSPLETSAMLSLRLEPRKVLEIPNGVAATCTTSSLTDQPEFPLPSRYVLYLGRVNWKKGLNETVASLAEAPGVNLVIAGNDEENLAPALRSLAATLGVSDRVFMVGFVDGSAKSWLLANAVALVLASRSENFGNAAAESMAHGTPVILSGGVGLTDFVRMYGGGLIVDRNPTSIAAAIRRLWSDDWLRKELSAQAHLAVQQHLSWDAIAARFETEYYSLLANEGNISTT
jgi:glycosyltransferase involved in cell wall biosynthesis